MKVLLLVFVVVGCSGAPCDSKLGQCTGILERQHVSADGRFRYCEYSDDFELTVGYFEECPLTD